MNHRETAEQFLATAMEADFKHHAAWASSATAHAVLALLDLFQNEDEDAEEIRRLHRRIAFLEGDLEGARAALRACDEALNTEMKAAADD